MSDLQAQVRAAPQPLDGTEPTIYVAKMAPLRKDGSPVLGSFGAQIGSLVIMDLATWKRLCAENPGLQTTRFRVGAL